MKDNYTREIKLQCVVCGSNEDFDSNEDKSYIKCTNCGKEYYGGQDELSECNQALIDEEIKEIKEEVIGDLTSELKKIFRK